MNKIEINENLSHQFKLNEVCSFRKTDEQWGGLSNMKTKVFPLKVNNYRIDNSESLYQMCRFPDYPEIQKMIVDDPSPMGSKMKSKKYRKTHTRIDFEEVKVEIMYWCFKVKLCCNPNGFGNLLEQTGNRLIVEISHKDKFWGVVEDKKQPGLYHGSNVLGQLLVQLRDSYIQNKNSLSHLKVETLDIGNFKFLGKQIETICNPGFVKTEVK